MKITTKIKKAIKKDPMKLTEREFYILSELAENEIQEWSMFLVNLHNEYNKGKKGVAKTPKGKRLGKKV
jgi:hypothetical protein